MQSLDTDHNKERLKLRVMVVLYGAFRPQIRTDMKEGLCIMLSCFCQKPRRKSESILAKLFGGLCIITDILSSAKYFLAI